MSKLVRYALFSVCPSVVGLIISGFMSTSTVHGQGVGFQSTDLHQLKSVGDIQMSPNEGVILYSLTTRLGSGRPSSGIWVHDLQTGSDRPLLSGSGSGARWSKDGSRIAYFGQLGDRIGLLMVGADGSNPIFLAEVRGTNHPLPSSGEMLTWSPDGSEIAFISTTPGPESAEANGDPVVITRYLYKPTASEGLTKFNDNRRAHIFIVDVETRSVRQLTEGPYYEHSVDWSPTSDEILFVSNRGPNPDQVFNYDIFSVSATDGAIRQLTQTENAEYRPRWSPDGQSIAYQGTRRGLTSSETTMEDTHLWVMDRSGSNRRDIGADIDNRQGPPHLSTTGRSIYVTVQERGAVELYRIAVDGSGQVEVIKGPGRVESWGLGGGDDGTIAYAYTTMTDTAQLYLLDGGGARQLTDLNRDLLGARDLAPTESLHFLSFDGLEVEAFLTHPVGVRPGSKHPMIVMLKGGPHSQRGIAFYPHAQAYSAQGWAVLTVNYRGSTGYGQAFADAIFRDQNGGEAKDVIYAVQAALRRHDWLDSERVGLEGRSYGGQLTNWLITQTNMFSAAVPIAGISNLITQNYMAYYHDYLAVEFGAYPHQEDLMDLLWERSPLKHVANVKTPTMFIHGENDADVTIAEAEQFYIALHDVGVPTVMVRYPREGHGIRETAHYIDQIDRSVDWYRTHFGIDIHP